MAEPRRWGACFLVTARERLDTAVLSSTSHALCSFPLFASSLVCRCWDRRSRLFFCFPTTARCSIRAVLPPPTRRRWGGLLLRVRGRRACGSLSNCCSNRALLAHVSGGDVSPWRRPQVSVPSFLCVFGVRRSYMSSSSRVCVCVPRCMCVFACGRVVILSSFLLSLLNRFSFSGLAFRYFAAVLPFHSSPTCRLASPSCVSSSMSLIAFFFCFLLCASITPWYAGALAPLQILHCPILSPRSPVFFFVFVCFARWPRCVCAPISLSVCVCVCMRARSRPLTPNVLSRVDWLPPCVSSSARPLGRPGR